jgi:hypothetical protein
MQYLHYIMSYLHGVICPEAKLLLVCQVMGKSESSTVKLPFASLGYPLGNCEVPRGCLIPRYLVSLEN